MGSAQNIVFSVIMKEIPNNRYNGTTISEFDLHLFIIKRIYFTTVTYSMEQSP
jgi:hypothetical protein